MSFIDVICVLVAYWLSSVIPTYKVNCFDLEIAYARAVFTPFRESLTLATFTVLLYIEGESRKVRFTMCHLSVIYKVLIISAILHFIKHINSVQKTNMEI